MDEQIKITEIFKKMGAGTRQAESMARQLIKRADQLVESRRCSRLAAMEYLLSLAVSGAEGIAPPGFEGTHADGQSMNVKVSKPNDTVDASRGANQLPDSMRNRVECLFVESFGRSPSVVCRAPGRVEFVGNHTDYNGGPVLGAAVDRGVWVAVAPRADGLRRFRSDQSEGVVDVEDPSIRREGGSSWVNYPLGVLAALKEFGLSAPEGFDYAVCADLPVGAGLSSSAAIELSSGLAFLGLTRQSVDRETLVKIGRHAENHFVGVPCGILDQGVSGFGRKNQLVYIDCSGPTFDTVPMPEGADFWIFNTHTKHALVDGLYLARHEECLAAARGLSVSQLALASEDLLETQNTVLGPVELKRARHIVGEVARVRGTISALAKNDLDEVGRLITASHRSSQTNFENSTAELDFLVDQLEGLPGVYGARLTGGGFGGAVMALTDDKFDASAAEVIKSAYFAEYGAPCVVVHLRTAEGAEVVLGPQSTLSCR